MVSNGVNAGTRKRPNRNEEDPQSDEAEMEDIDDGDNDALTIVSEDACTSDSLSVRSSENNSRFD